MYPQAAELKAATASWKSKSRLKADKLKLHTAHKQNHPQNNLRVVLCYSIIKATNTRAALMALIFYKLFLPGFRGQVIFFKVAVQRYAADVQHTGEFADIAAGGFPCRDESVLVILP